MLKLYINFRIFVSICLDITQFGIAVVFLLLASKNISSFLDSFFSVKVDFCVLILMVSVILWPITMLKSPKDFWSVKTLLLTIFYFKASGNWRNDYDHYCRYINLYWCF